MNRWLVGLVVITLVVIGGLCAVIGRIRDANHALSLRVYNDSAALDTSRSLALSRKDSLRILGDSLAGVTKLALQRTQERDDLDRALHQERKVTLALRVTIDSLHVTAVPSVAPVTTDTATGARQAMFHVEQGAYTADARVQLPAAGAGTMDLTVKVSPAHIGLRIGCQAKNADGIRPARVTATSPPWLSIFIDHAEQDADVCQSVAAQRSSLLRSIFRTLTPQFTVGFGLAANPVQLIQGKAVEIQPAIYAGVSLWHWP